jgi:hypothetical protein
VQSYRPPLPRVRTAWLPEPLFRRKTRPVRSVSVHAACRVRTAVLFLTLVGPESSGPPSWIRLLGRVSDTLSWVHASSRSPRRPTLLLPCDTLHGRMNIACVTVSQSFPSRHNVTPPSDPNARQLRGHFAMFNNGRPADGTPCRIHLG